ncbi:MAG TPA: SigB/SigF/SigG family RNA polymerase sigma factor [Armatimonadota bacterium]|nr:SigB/SigF/SigG family RNA polymerase sigma factor [Armatimonadota bacterium]
MEDRAFRDRSTEELLQEYVADRRPELRTAIIERHEALVRSLAHKFARPGVPVEDLVQSAWIALIGALDRFDPSHETKFSTYAVHCMVGEIKRYFRDRTWSIKVPRYLQEIAANLHRMEDELYRKLQREPTVAEMAEAFNISEEDLVHAMEMYRAYQMQRLEERREMDDGNDSLPLGETIGGPDHDLESVVESAPLHDALSALDERKQKILRRRFFEGYSQQEVADELGLSQMHISRLERSALQQLRQNMAAAQV